jgi:hypothetical protein
MSDALTYLDRGLGLDVDPRVTKRQRTAFRRAFPSHFDVFAVFLWLFLVEKSAAQRVQRPRFAERFLPETAFMAIV